MPKRIDITGRKFGSLKVIKHRPDMKKGRRMLWECYCECGGIVFSFYDTLSRGSIKTCGLCLVNKNIGNKFGRLTILRFTGCKKRLNYVSCRCDCGNEIEAPASYVVRKIVSSCGCRRKEIYLKKSIQKIGLKFHRLKVMKINGKDEKGNTLLLCRCKCGKNTVVRTGNINHIKSCGCLHKINISKGENVANAKLKNSEAESIRALYKSKSGYTKKELAEMFGLTIDTLRRVLRNASYKDYQYKE